MGAAASNQTRQMKEPLEIGEFRKLQAPTDQYVIPEVPVKRQVTDFKFTITFAVLIVALVPFLIYTFVHSDINRFVRGFDKCGNICGRNNTHVDGIDCSGKDQSKLPLLKYTKTNVDVGRYYTEDDMLNYECAESCDTNQYVIILNRCFPAEDNNESQEFAAELTSDINKSAGYIVALCLIGLGFSVGMLFLFRYFVAVVVWVILIGSIVGFIILTIVMWVVHSNADSSNKQFWQYMAIFFTILSVVFVIMLICMFKRIKLVIRLFKEAIQVIFGIPLILFEPLLTLLASTILLIILVFFLIIFATTGTLQLVNSDLYEYVPNGVMIFTWFFHIVICLWMAQFIVGCQHMVISGAVSAYYFSRDKSTLTSPIYNSFYNLIRYHLGTVAFGSLIITIIAIIKALIRSLVNSRQAKVLIDCCLGAIEDFLKYLSKNAYIQTAMHGQPFYISGKRAVRLLWTNALSTIAVNSVGDFVMNMAKVLIVVCTVGVGILIRDSSITHFWAAIVISAIVTGIIADCFFAVFETAVDTIFLCFCEDRCMNDGMDRPYYMTTNLMQYIEDAKKTVKDKDRQ
ncbi:hypothetical protein Zmor_006928 [Zophobas morio]|uniref:Choline transporter-like protein n=1 Tax=Zophobas morio TaxID=2755281 RepID=A0AA38MNV2_9CUCU|nr:hypothetical protein Zmor_006928 [Zophobas morio]